jgi:hypothetical protein
MAGFPGCRSLELVERLSAGCLVVSLTVGMMPLEVMVEPGACLGVRHHRWMERSQMMIGVGLIVAGTMSFVSVR